MLAIGQSAAQDAVDNHGQQSTVAANIAPTKTADGTRSFDTESVS